LKDFEIKLFDSFNGEVQEIWTSMQNSSSCYVFQTYEWQKYWFDTVGTSIYFKPLIVCVYYQSSLVAIFPLGLKKIYGIKIIEFLGGGQNDYNNPILANEPDVLVLTKAWSMALEKVKSYDVVNICRIPEKISHFDNVFLRVMSFYVSGTLNYSTLPKLSDKTIKIASTRVLKDNRRMRRRLSELGGLSFSVLTSADDCDAIIKETLKQKKERYRDTGARNILENSNIYKFYHNLLSSVPFAHLSILKLDDDIIAAHLGAVFQGRFYYLMPTFLTGEYEKYSPGRLLLEELVKWSVDNKIDVFDFTVGSESYKKKWCNGSMSIYSHLSCRTASGCLFIFFQKLLDRVKKNNTNVRSILMKLNKLKNRVYNVK